MRVFLVLLGKHIHETRWNLFFCAWALFGLAWLLVFATSRTEEEVTKQLASVGEGEGGDKWRIQMLRNMGVGESPSSGALIMASWTHPFIMILLSVWSIGRGSAAVAAEIERGTMDFLLSRPVSRFTYMAAQVVMAVAGILVLAFALYGGAMWGVHLHALREPPTARLFLKPTINLAALGLPIYGYTLLASACDQVRWRPTALGASLTLGGFIAFVLAAIPVFHDQPWRPWLERISIFKAYAPVELVTTGDSFTRNVAILSGLGSGLIVLAFAAFAVRDVPTNS